MCPKTHCALIQPWHPVRGHAAHLMQPFYFAIPSTSVIDFVYAESPLKARNAAESEYPNQCLVGFSAVARDAAAYLAKDAKRAEAWRIRYRSADHAGQRQRSDEDSQLRSAVTD